MAWYYYLNGGNQGPVELPELQRLHTREVITLDTPVWTDGMTDWAPLHTTPAMPAAIGATQTCAQCGKVFPESEMLQYESTWVCAACKPLFFQRIKEGVAPVGVMVYAPVWKRFLALVLDIVVIVVGMMVIMMPVMFLTGAFAGHTKPEDMSGWTFGIFAIFMVFVYASPIAYEIYFIGKYGATLGKMALGIKVIRSDTGRVSYGRATGRYFAKILSGMILYIGYLMAFWDDEKRALHDHLCDTRVIDTNAS